jgi:hypothetical protein
MTQRRLLKSMNQQELVANKPYLPEDIQPEVKIINHVTRDDFLRVSKISNAVTNEPKLNSRFCSEPCEVL